MYTKSTLEEGDRESLSVGHFGPEVGFGPFCIACSRTKPEIKKNMNFQKT